MLCFAFELFLARYLRHFGLATAPDRSYHTIEAAIGRIVDGPASLLVLVDLSHTSMEFRAFF